jgi:hypothetical protein
MEAAVDSLGCSASSRLGDEQAKATLQLDLEEYKKRAGYLSAKVFPSNQRSSQKEVEDPEPTCTEVTDLNRGRQTRFRLLYMWFSILVFLLETTNSIASRKLLPTVNEFYTSCVELLSCLVYLYRNIS